MCLYLFIFYFTILVVLCYSSLWRTHRSQVLDWLHCTHSAVPQLKITLSWFVQICVLEPILNEASLSLILVNYWSFAPLFVLSAAFLKNFLVQKGLLINQILILSKPSLGVKTGTGRWDNCRLYLFSPGTWRDNFPTVALYSVNRRGYWSADGMYSHCLSNRHLPSHWVGVLMLPLLLRLLPAINGTQRKLRKHILKRLTLGPRQ